MIALRTMSVHDAPLVKKWDEDPDVAASGGMDDWYDWPTELRREVEWRELLLICERDRPIGVVQLIDAAEEETHYWGEVEPHTWAIDIWIGARSDRGRGLGSQALQQALSRCFADHSAKQVLIDPLVRNKRAIKLYQRIGFTEVGERWFDEHHCLVLKMTAASFNPRVEG